MTTGSSREQRRRRNAWFGALREVVVVIVLALLLATLIRVFLVQAFLIPSGSMMDTLQIGDRVLVSKLTTRFGEVERGDVVVFTDPGSWLGPQEDVDRNPVEEFLEFVGLVPESSENHLVKRVIGVGGDTVACCTDEGLLTINGTAVDETEVLRPGVSASDSQFDVTVPEGSLWVMGDNRSNSGDSRFNGPVPVDDVTGRVFAIAWPVSRWQGVGGEEVYAGVPDAAPADPAGGPEGS